MERVILRHLTGNKANQEVVFAADGIGDGITIGRDADCRFEIDEADDVVSRQHARIEKTPNGFIVIDRKSANGVFVNGVRVRESMPLHHGDILRLGQGGPEVSFKLDPPPAVSKQTRLESMPAKATRIAGAQELSEPAHAVGTAGAVEPGTPGRMTSLEHVIREQREALDTQGRRSRRVLLNFAVAALAVAGAIAAWLFYDGRTTAQQLARQHEAASQLNAALEKQKALTDEATRQLQTRIGLPEHLKKEYGPSTVLLEVTWRLTEATTGRQLFHMYLPPDKHIQKLLPRFPGQGLENPLPAYREFRDGSRAKLEPLLGFDGNESTAIGYKHHGSGFVVSPHGVIMTNRHVAATWHTIYPVEFLKFPGLVVEITQDGRPRQLRLIQEPDEDLKKWVPARSIVARAKGGLDHDSRVVGRNEVLNVVFPKSNLRVPGQLGTVSPEHDAALVKIETAIEKLKPLPMADRRGSIQGGEPVVLLGYPGISAKSAIRTVSKDQFNPHSDISMLTDVSVNVGVLSKEVDERYYSERGATYELSINSAGSGNSGGPVFDAQGKVIGIFTAAAEGYATAISMATPIRFGLELLNPMTPVSERK